MANEVGSFHSKAIPPKQAHEIRRHSAIELQKQVRKLTKELEQVRGSAQWNPYRHSYDINSIDIAYFFSYEDFDDEEWGPRRRMHPMDELRDLKVEASELDDNRNIENYLDLVQVIKRIFELKEYNNEKSFKLAFLNWRGMIQYSMSTWWRVDLDKLNPKSKLDPN